MPRLILVFAGRKLILLVLSCRGACIDFHIVTNGKSSNNCCQGLQLASHYWILSAVSSISLYSRGIMFLCTCGPSPARDLQSLGSLSIRWISFFLRFIKVWMQRVTCKANMMPFWWHLLRTWPVAFILWWTSEKWNLSLWDEHIYKSLIQEPWHHDPYFTVHLLLTRLRFLSKVESQDLLMVASWYFLWGCISL